MFAVIFSACFSNNDSLLSEEIIYPKNRFISSSSAKDQCITRKIFDCGLKADLEELYSTLKGRKSLVPEMVVVSGEENNGICELHFKSSYQLDIKPTSIKYFKRLIEECFNRLLNILQEEGKTFHFKLNHDSFIYDAKEAEILFVDLPQILIYVRQNYLDVNFIQVMKNRLTELLSSYQISNLNLDFELEDFKIGIDPTYVEVLFEKLYASDLKEIKENKTGPYKSIHLIEIQKRGFVDNLEIRLIRTILELSIVVTLNDVAKKYKFEENNDMLAIYVCQNELNEGASNCINLSENKEEPLTTWNFKVAPQIRYDISVVEVETLKNFINRKFLKVFITLMDINARGVITTTDLRNTDKMENYLTTQLYLRDDGKDDIKYDDKLPWSETRSFKMKKRALILGKDISIFKLPYDKVKGLRIFNGDPRAKYYQMDTLDTKTAIISDEKGDNHPIIFYLRTLLPNISIIKTCNSPFPHLYGTFENNIYKLIYRDVEKIYPNFVNLIAAKSFVTPLEKCIQLEGDSKYKIRYEYEGHKDNMNFRWNFNSHSDFEEISYKLNKVYLSEIDKKVISDFEFKTFEYPKFSKKSIFLSISKVSDKNEYLIQGVYFQESSMDRLTMNPKKEKLTVSNVPKAVYFNKDYSIKFTGLDSTPLIDQPVNFLNDDEIVYNIKNECLKDYIPTIKFSDKKQKVVINCVNSKDYKSLSLSGAGEEKLTFSLNAVIKHIPGTGRHIV